MANLFHRAARLLTRAMPRESGLVYTRAGTPIAVTGWAAGTTHHETTGEDMLLTTVESIDWTILAAELGLTPRAGDLVVAAGVTYEVLPVGDKPCFDRLDTTSGLMFLVRTKRIS